MLKIWVGKIYWVQSLDDNSEISPIEFSGAPQVSVHSIATIIIFWLHGKSYLKGVTLAYI